MGTSMRPCEEGIGLHCHCSWTVVVPPEAEYTLNIVHAKEMVRVHDAWGYLLDAGRGMGKKHDIQPEDLILSSYSYLFFLFSPPCLNCCSVTRAGTDQRFKIRDLRRVQYWPSHTASTHGFHQPHFGGHSFHHGHGMAFGGRGHFGHQPFGGYGAADTRQLIPGQDLAPKVFYLFTSGDKDHEPYFSLTPMHVPRPEGEKPPELSPSQVRCFALVDM